MCEKYNFFFPSKFNVWIIEYNLLPGYIKKKIKTNNTININDYKNNEELII